MTDTYTADVRWEDGHWQGTVRDVPGAHSYARTTNALRKRLREVIVLMDDRPDSNLHDESAFTVSFALRVAVGDDAGLSDHASGGSTASIQVSAIGHSTSSGFAEATIVGRAPDEALKIAADARATAAKAEKDAEHATSMAVLIAQGAGIGLRDIAMLLGISYQRVAQIAALQAQPVVGAAAGNDRYVQRRGDGNWEIVKAPGGRASAVFSTQREAVNRAREILHNGGGGELVVKGTDGKIRSKLTVAPISDRASSKGQAAFGPIGLPPLPSHRRLKRT